MKTVLITGANSGIGFATAQKFIELKEYQVALCCRNQTAGRFAQESLGSNSTAYSLDLANLNSINEFILKWTGPIDILVCNAGIWGPPQLCFASDSGLELTLATNHLGHFALVIGLLNAGKLSQNCQILVVSSSLHNPQETNGKMGRPNFDFDDLKWTRNNYDSRTAYQNSKLANIWFTFELDRMIKKKKLGIRVNAICPGFVPTTQLSRNSSFIKRVLMYYILPLFSFTTSLDQAAEWMVQACLNEESGKVFSKGKVIESSLESYDQEKAAKLWELSLGKII